MTCQEATSLAHPYADGELDLMRSVQLEKHMADCPVCSQTYENVKSLRSKLQSGELYFKAPKGLRRRIRNSIHDKNPSFRRVPVAWWQLFRFRLSAAGLALMMALLVIFVSSRESAENRVALDVTASHVRSLMAAHLTDVASSDQHTVKPWFQGKLDFTPPVIDLAQHGFPLVGGRLDYLQSHPVAALVYQRHQHLINLFIWPVAGNSALSEKISIRQGYNLIHWTASGMTFWAVSDLNRAELSEFVQRLK